MTVAALRETTNKNLIKTFHKIKKRPLKAVFDFVSGNNSGL